ncbi:hypothetical protein [Streptomyces sp. NPDC051567]|uniref:hypothetical protein n=1 Tax=Streptomyces sp. NPDC051567 TaxID=3365660 RepID=UPI0037B60BEA
MRDLPPHLRLLAWPALNGRSPLSGVTVTVPAALADGPVSLACYSPDTAVAFAPGHRGGAGAAALLTAPESEEPLAEPLRLVGTLALWDEVVREAGVYGGNIYLAAEGSVARLLRTAHGDDLPGSVEPAELLEQLHALELLYRFPVAYKFRGAHGRERQCRVNGWGRLLFRTLDATDTDPYGFTAARERLVRHLDTHRDAYLRGVRAASAAADHDGARVWEDIHAEQPIPVLI